MNDKATSDSGALNSILENMRIVKMFSQTNDVYFHNAQVRQHVVNMVTQSTTHNVS